MEKVQLRLLVDSKIKRNAELPNVLRRRDSKRLLLCEHSHFKVLFEG
jgi:hypothetical protein